MILHTIRTNINGETKQVKLTYKSACRAMCRECVCWSTREVIGCTAPLCPLWPFRHSSIVPSNPRKGGNKAGIQALQKHRKKHGIQPKD